MPLPDNQPDAGDFRSLLASLCVPPANPFILRRLVPKTDLERYSPPDYLFTSGYASRYNPHGIEALYGAEDAATAGVEWDRIADRIGTRLQHVLYTIEATAPVLDLGDTPILAALQLNPDALSEPWEFAPTPTKTQLLGSAIAGQHRFGAIRFPSDSAQKRGFVGYNRVLFKTAVIAPMSVVIRNDRGEKIQSWS